MRLAQQHIERSRPRQHQRHRIGEHPQPLRQACAALALDQQVGAEFSEPRLRFFTAQTRKAGNARETERSYRFALAYSCALASG
jgi:hypothetical protein